MLRSRACGRAHRKGSPASGWCHPDPRALPGAKLASPPPLPAASLCRPARSSASLEQKGHVRGPQLAVPSTRTGGGDWHRPGQASSLASLHEDPGEKVARRTVAQSVSPGTGFILRRREWAGRIFPSLPTLHQRPPSHQPPGSPSWAVSPGLLCGQARFSAATGRPRR